MVKHGSWEEYKLLCIPIMWLGASIYCFANLCLPLIMRFPWLLFANFALGIIINITVLKVGWYESKYKGLQINVREPHVGFWKMPYDIDPAEVGTNPFAAAFSWHISSVVIPAEAGVHMFMGNDLQRASFSGDNTACIGMMTQEMNHGTAQLFYSRACEKCLGYPEGFRLLWKICLYQIFPMKLRAAFLLWIESTFVVVQLALKFFTVEQIFGEPAWLWAWHFTEEAEHSWDYVQETNPKVPWIYKAVMWLIAGPLIFCLWIMAILQGIWYGKATFWKHPSRLVTSPFMHIIYLQILLFAMSLSFLEMILGMRLDDIYEVALHGMYKRFEEYKHLFKITHTQSPGSEHLRKVGEMPPRSSIANFQEARKSLYGEIREKMRKSGMSEKEIRRTSFALVAQENKYNPLL